MFFSNGKEASWAIIRDGRRPFKFKSPGQTGRQVVTSERKLNLRRDSHIKSLVENSEYSRNNQKSYEESFELTRVKISFNFVD